MPGLMKPAIAAVFAAVCLLPISKAHARFFDPALAAVPSLTEDVACRTVRERIVRPNGRVVWRTRSVCTRPRPVYRPVCRTIRERVVRPSGRVVYRSIRRCG